jgi:hypothetical protein
MLAWAEALPDGARGWISVAWDKGGGHIFNVEKSHGRVRYIDAQVGDLDFDIDSYIKLGFGGGIGKAWRYVRVDDLEPTDAVMEYITS